MNEKLDLQEFEKHVMDISVISESENGYFGTIKWNVSKSDFMEKFCNISKKEIKSNWFSIGSPSYCSFRLQLYNRDFCSVGITFKNKIPENAWIEGNMSIDGFSDSKTFSVCGKDADKEINLDFLTTIHEVVKYINATDYDPIIQCFIKIKLKQVKCTLDKHTVQHVESRNYDLYEKYLPKCDALSDVTICVESCEMKSHKALLAKVPLFKQLFDKNESERYFVFTDISKIIFQTVLNYLCTEAIPELNFRLACELYVVASDLKIFDLKFICSSYLGANLTEKNVFIVNSLSGKCYDIFLKKECIKFIKTSNIEELAKNSIVL